MSAEYEKSRGVKLPARHKGSMFKSGAGLTDKADVMASTIGQSQLIAQSAAQPQITQ